jgi:hypothetical protein
VRAACFRFRPRPGRQSPGQPRPAPQTPVGDHASRHVPEPPPRSKIAAGAPKAENHWTIGPRARLRRTRLKCLVCKALFRSFKVHANFTKKSAAEGEFAMDSRRPW